MDRRTVKRTWGGMNKVARPHDGSIRNSFSVPQLVSQVKQMNKRSRKPLLVCNRWQVKPTDYDITMIDHVSHLRSAILTAGKVFPDIPSSKDSKIGFHFFSNSFNKASVSTLPSSGSKGASPVKPIRIWNDRRRVVDFCCFCCCCCCCFCWCCRRCYCWLFLFHHNGVLRFLSTVQVEV